MIKTMAGSTVIYAVLKGNGLGLGLMEMAQTIIAAGIDRFCVTEPDDVRRLTESSLPIKEILVLRPLADKTEIERIIDDARVTFTIGACEDMELLCRLALDHNVVVSAHVAIDTGLGRYGLPWNDLEAICRLYNTHNSIKFTGVFTHFSAPGRRNSVIRQYRRFRRVLQKLDTMGIDPGLRHCASSAVFLLRPEMKMDAVRIGSAFLGRSLGSEYHGLHLVGCCEAQVIAVHEIAAGQTVGYGSSFRALRNMQAAVVDIGTTHGLRLGYACGKRSTLSRVSEICGAVKRAFHGHAIFSGEINDHIVPVIGNVFAECAVVDVTGCDCNVGDTVRFLINPMFIQNMDRVWT